MLGYFGESYTAPCGNCDNCTQPVESWDATMAAQKALSCVYRTGQRFEASHLSDILSGNSTKRVKMWGHDKIKTFGFGQDLTQTDWFSVYRQLLTAGMLSVDLGEISGFRLTPESWPVLKGERQIYFHKDPRPAKSQKTKPRRSASVTNLSDEKSSALFEKLRRLRLQISKELGLPPYVVFHDSTLIEMAESRPQTRTALLQISGVGENRRPKNTASGFWMPFQHHRSRSSTRIAAILGPAGSQRNKRVICRKKITKKGLQLPISVSPLYSW